MFCYHIRHSIQINIFFVIKYSLGVFQWIEPKFFIKLSTNTGISRSETIIQNKHDMWFVSAHSSDKELNDIDSSEVCLLGNSEYVLAESLGHLFT